MPSKSVEFQPGEELVYVARPTMVMSYASLGVLALILLVAGILWDRYREAYIWLVAAIAALPSLITLARRWIFILSNRFELTNRRVILSTGLLSKQSVSSYLEKINNVEYRQSVAGRIFGYGDVIVDTASETGTTVFKGIAKPVAFQRAILAASEPYRGPHPAYAAAPAPSGADRLRDLRKLLDDGLISQAEYDEKRKDLLKAL